MKARLIVGLGNPGSRYEKTRHNIGFRLLEQFAQEKGLVFKEEKKFSGSVAKGHVSGETIFLLKPATYMNESGRAVRKVIDFYKVDPAEVVVVADDIAIPFQQMRLKGSGSAGGHNGLKSVQSHLGTANYVRLRLGIGDRHQGQLADHVLSRFSQQEEEKMDLFLRAGIDVLNRLIHGETLERIMNDVNRRVRKKEVKKPTPADNGGLGETA